MSKQKMKLSFKTAERTRNFFSGIAFVFILLSSTGSFAQWSSPPGFGDDVNDEKPVAPLPIDSNILFLSSAAIALGFYLVRKNQKLIMKK